MTRTLTVNSSTQTESRAQVLDVMVGTWGVKGSESGPEGEIHGRLTFEWMDGGFYLIQHVDIDYFETFGRDRHTVRCVL
jgi:hypothetical protein